MKGNFSNVIFPYRKSNISECPNYTDRAAFEQQLMFSWQQLGQHIRDRPAVQTAQSIPRIFRLTETN